MSASRVLARVQACVPILSMATRVHVALALPGTSVRRAPTRVIRPLVPMEPPVHPTSSISSLARAPWDSVAPSASQTSMRACRTPVRTELRVSTMHLVLLACAQMDLRVRLVQKISTSVTHAHAPTEDHVPIRQTRMCVRVLSGLREHNARRTSTSVSRVRVIWVGSAWIKSTNLPVPAFLALPDSDVSRTLTNVPRRLVITAQSATTLSTLFRAPAWQALRETAARRT